MSWFYSLVVAGLLFASDVQQPAVRPTSHEIQPETIAERTSADEIEKFEQSYPLSRNGKVSVSNVNGSITVEAWDREEVRLEATKIADSKETLADVDIQVQSTADSFSVEADYKGWKWNNRRNENQNRKLEVQFRLSVPRGAVLDEIEAVNGSVTVSNFTNVTKISAVNGDVSATNLRGTARLSTVNGQVTADFDSVEAATKINLSTVNGRVSLVLPSDVNATVKADSLNGEITNDFGLPVRKGQYVGRDLYGRIGSGETEVKLSSVNGSLSIGKKSDGRTPNPATNLLPAKKAGESDWDVDEHAKDAAKINREVERTMRESQKNLADSMKEARKALEAVPDVELFKLEEMKKLEKFKIDVDEKELQKKIKETADWQDRLVRSARFSGMPTIEKKRNNFVVKGTPKVTIEASGCSVSVRGWDKSEVQYAVTEIAGRRSQPTIVTEDHNSSMVTLKIINKAGNIPAPTFDVNPERVRVEVFVPRKTNLKLTSDGEIRLDGISGQIELTGLNESINIRDVDGGINITANEAQVRVIGFKGDFKSQTACGDVFLEGDFKALSAKGTDGTVTLTVPTEANATVVSNAELESEGVNVVRENENTWRLGTGGTRYNFDLPDGRLVLRSSSAISSN